MALANGRRNTEEWTKPYFGYDGPMTSYDIGAMTWPFESNKVVLKNSIIEQVGGER